MYSGVFNFFSVLQAKSGTSNNHPTGLNDNDAFLVIKNFKKLLQKILKKKFDFFFHFSFVFQIIFLKNCCHMLAVCLCYYGCPIRLNYRFMSDLFIRPCRKSYTNLKKSFR